MQQAIEQLMESVESTNGDAENPDILNLGLLLEMNSYSGNRSDLEKGSLLPASLQNVLLSKNEQTEIVSRLARLIQNSNNAKRKHFFWVFSKASPQVAFMPLVRIITELYISFDPETSYQALSALDHHIFQDHDEMMLANHSHELKNSAILEFLVLMNTPVVNQRIGSIERIANKIRSAIERDPNQL
jgi:hypothetical protein